MKAVFQTNDGPSSSVNIVEKYTHPLNGKKILYRIDSIPNQAEAINLASSEQIDQLPNETELIMIGLNLSSESGDVSTRKYHLLSLKECNLETINNNEYMCIQQYPVPAVCQISLASSGTPIIVEQEDGSTLQLGYKSIEGCNQPTAHPVTSYLKEWAQLISAKNNGLSVATAYEFPEKRVGKTDQLRVSIENRSIDRVFNFSGFRFATRHTYSLGQHSCHTLNPGESCFLNIHSRLNAPILSIEKLNFTVNKRNTSIYFSATAFDHIRIEGDRQSKWLSQGWISTQPDFGGSLYTENDLNSVMKLQREKYVVGPTKVTIRYKTSIPSSMLGVNITRNNIKGDINVQQPLNLFGGFVPISGTNGEWIETEFPINEPGSYTIAIKSLLLFNQPLNFYAEIDSICIGPCDF